MNSNSSQMLRWRKTLWLVALALLCFAGNGRAVAAPGAGAEITVLETTPGRTLVELTVDGYEIESVRQEGVDYQQFTISGTTLTQEPGEPQLPTAGALLGLPTVSGLTIDVLDAKYETLDAVRVAPAPYIEYPLTLLSLDGNWGEGDGGVLERNAPEAGTYAVDAYFPGPLAESGEAGLMRDQAAAQITFNPVQYNPILSQARLYTRILVEISVDISGDGDEAVLAANHGASTVSADYEKVLSHSLLNYDTLSRPQPTSASTIASAQTSTVSAIPDTKRLRIGVEEDGIFMLSFDDLSDAGFEPESIDPRKLRMTNRGADIPILVAGETDGSFDAGDAVIWYGTKLDDVYTLANIYWLEEGNEAGPRMTERDVVPAGAAAVATTFPWTIHAEVDQAYWQGMPNGEGQDHYFWGGQLSPSTDPLPVSRAYTVTLRNIAPAAEDAVVRVRLKGYTTLAHRTQILLNGTLIDDQAWSGQIDFDHIVPIDHSLLVDGDNVLTVKTVDTGASVDLVLVNWFEIDYVETYVAEDNQLPFAAPAVGEHAYTVTGFGSETITLLDITSPTTPVRLINATVAPDGGKYKLGFDATAAVNSRFLAAAEPAYLSPANSTLDTPSTWRSAAHGADYIIITHSLFDAAAQQLANHRQGQGLRVAKIDVQDLYDEFNYGVFNPSAIRDFLAYAYENWQSPAPVYVVLIGDSPIDFKDNRDTGTTSYLPTQIIETRLLGETATDHWFTTISGEDELPDLFLGRLSVESAAEAADVVAKLIAYDLTPPDDAWNQRLAMVADDGGSDFPGLSEALIDRSPHYYNATRIYVENYPPGDPASDIHDAFADGAVLMNYTGHGSTQHWGKWLGQTFFDNDKIAALTNTDRLPFVTVANCLSGFFAGSSDYISVAESLQRLPKKGAIAVFAPTDLGFTFGHHLLMEEVYSALFFDDLASLGAATTAAKIASIAQSSRWTGMAQTYVLLGDPYTKLGIPTNVPYVTSTSPANGEDGVAIDQNVQVRFSKPVDPETVSLSGLPSVSPNPIWNEDFTIVEFSHDDLTSGESYQLAVNAEDKFGNALGEGIVPRLWTFVVVSERVFLPLVAGD